MRARGSAQAGFTYLGILAAIILMGLLLTAAARVWTQTEQRERETSCCCRDSIRMAIAAYYAHGSRYPNALQDLLEDNRSPVPVRYLRRIYLDPMTNSADWKLCSPRGRHQGVYSGSGITPIKRANFPIIDISFADTDCYCAWQFVYEPRFRRRVAPATVKPQ